MTSHEIPDVLRTDIWEHRVDADRLERYYGELAAVHARRSRYTMAAGFAVAVLTPLISLLVQDGAVPLIVIVVGAMLSVAGIVIAVYTISTGHRQIVESMFRCYQFGALKREWDDLWQGVEDERLEYQSARAAFSDLSAKADAITALSSQDRKHAKLLDATQKEAYGYYRQEDHAVVA